MWCILQHALSDKANVKTFDPKTTCLQECLITTFQEAYFVSESFEEAKEKMRQVVSLKNKPQIEFALICNQTPKDFKDETANNQCQE
ncbi:hypothetical protein E2320_003828 [Naja naja]|nr:hypothetical protein E2320_003828 [Naja naja]